MGFWLRDRIKTWTNVTSADTQRLELPNSGILSAIEIRVNNTRDATARTAEDVCQHIAEAMSKLEVVETGQKIIKSLDGTVCLANNLYDFKRPVFHKYMDHASKDNSQHFFLLFGRYIMDKEYGLDLAKHKDVRLEIVHAFSETASTGWDDDAGDIEVFVWRWIGTEFRPKGYFKTSEKFHYTASGNAGEVRSELPALNPYRRIMIRTFLTTKTIGACLTELSLVVNDGAYKPFYGVPGDRMSAQDQAVHGIEAAFGGRIFLAAALGTGYTESFISYPEVALSHQMSDQAAYISGMVGWDAGRIYIKETGGTNHLHQLLVKGMGYQYVSTIPFDVPDNENAYFLTKGLDKLEVILNHGAHAADTKIVLDELVKY